MASSSTTSTAVSLLCSATSSSRFPFSTTLPAKSSSTLYFRANSLPATHAASSSSSFTGKDEILGRRGLVFTLTATLPLLLPFSESMEAFTAKAVEPDTSIYEVMKEEIRKVVSKGKAAGVLRFVFHDAGTFQLDDNSGGMNGSVIYELDRPENKGLKTPFKILEIAKTEVDAVQPVSWADMIAVAGAEAVSVCGGPTIPVALGRLDSKEPDPEGKLPEETLDAYGLKQSFRAKGLSTQELVALSGAHTLGNKGFGSPTVFDNSYFKVLLEESVSSGSMSSMTGLPSDRALPKDDECLRWIKKYADNENSFFEDFQNAYIKLVNSGARWKSL
ncbi:putative L-ascorbate peroxidase 6 isoform X2 [Rosa chinensis]|uniref:putative L-ascorbate peroxidase 6 isoform X2 n=1 Tax=Rosa chinensis TaxID=74649 RepID=UPI001AD8D87A|nr:putative L-ascorbate peroxidase 6 isoform X2 [Rosa chinensis]